MNVNISIEGWLSSAPTPMSDVSVCRINGLAKLGLCSTGEVHKYVCMSLAPEKQIYKQVTVLGCSSSLDLLTRQNSWD